MVSTIKLIELIDYLFIIQIVFSPFSQWSDPSFLDPRPLSALDMKSTPDKLSIDKQNKNVNVVKPLPESILSAMTIETLLKEIQSNGFKQDVSNSIYGGEIFKNLNNPYIDVTQRVKFECAVPPISCFNNSQNFYFRSYDGACNNFAHPGYGMAKTRYSRIVWPRYGDGQYTPSKSSTGIALPNPRILSLSLYGEDTLSDTFRTIMTMQFGQFVAHDISQLFQENFPGKFISTFYFCICMWKTLCLNEILMYKYYYYYYLKKNVYINIYVSIYLYYIGAFYSTISVLYL